MEWSFIILAAGESRRFGKVNKLDRDLEGLPVWMWSVDLAERLMKAGKIQETVLVVPKGQEEKFRDRVEGLEGRWFVATGGKSRTESVIKGLERARCERVLLHDAARPFASAGLCERVMEKVRRGIGAIPLIPVSDALKKIEDERPPRHIERDGLFATQTPQGFFREEILSLLSRRTKSCADEGQAWMEAGLKLETVKGFSENFKITYPEDLDLAKKVARGRRKIRTGIGYDIHPLAPGRSLVLGGYPIESNLGPVGHSDGDALCHAISDALLGAAGQPDIGTLFPASDPSIKGISSTKILSDVIDRLKTCLWSVEWVDAVVVLQTPRIAQDIARIKESLDGVFTDHGFEGIVNVRVKSGERTGPVGDSEAVMCYAVVTISGIETPRD
jgi:2-C-methyl-D-erythritol 4-phosphate cytidylyltransferase/2-C-methyl-D-erythritol 2,4-cyclodiphosphate synthase